MTIKRKSIISLALSILTMFIVTTLFFIVSVQRDSSLFTLKKLDNLILEIGELNAVTARFIADRGGPAQVEWLDVHQEASLTVSSLNQNLKLNIEPYQRIQGALESARLIFNQLVISKAVNNGNSEDLFKELFSVTKFIVEKSFNLKLETEENQANIEQFAQNVTFATIFLLIFIIFLNMVFTQYYVVKPLIKITELISKVKAENIKKLRLPIKTEDEIGLLANTFNSMAAQVQRLYKSLERKVKNRTKDLDAKVDELKKSDNEMNKVLKDLSKEKKNMAIAKAKSDAMLANIGDGLVFLNLDKKVILLNSVAEKLIGFSSKEAEGKLWFNLVKVKDDKGEIIPHKKLPVELASKSSKISISTSTADNYYYTHKKGHTIPVAITASKVIMNQKTLGIIVIFRSIIKEKQIDKAKTEFVSLASHQLRTPLTSIKWNSELLLAGDAGDLSKKQKDHISEIYKGNERMVTLVNSLLNVSRMDMNTFSIEPEPIDIVNFTKQLTKEMKPKLAERKIKLNEKYDKIGEVDLDPRLMRIIIENLLTNAIKYTPEKGKINLSITKSAKNLIIEVKDTGYGIPEGQKSKIFSKLFRADNVKVKDTEGTGLGLYLVNSIVKAIHGKISFKSKENKGTLFRIELPAQGIKHKKSGKKLDH